MGRTVENFAGFSRKPRWRKRFFQEGQVFVEHTVVGEGVIGVAGHEQHASPGQLGTDLIAKLLAAHLGHDDVGDHQIERRILTNKFESFKSVVGFFHTVAAFVQDGDGEPADGGIVLNDKD